MNRRTWVRLDNASNIFLGAMSDVDSKVFRLSAELAVDVDPALLQQALDAVFDQYVLYHSVLRRGVFWYYLEDSDLRPKVEPEVLPPCDHLYHFDRRELLFRVIHHRNRIILEVFHALSDGAGALLVFRDLVAHYIALHYSQDFPDLPASVGVKQALEKDSFTLYFHPDRAQSFADAAKSAPLDAGNRTGRLTDPGTRPPALIGGLRRRGRQRVHRIRGTRTPDNRTRVVELEMSTASVVQLARAQGCSLTIYLTALFLKAVRVVDGALTNPTMAVSLPVDLRQHFPSDSARNFFTTTRLEYTFGEGEDDLGAVCRSLREQLRVQTTPEALEAKLLKLIGFELNPFTRGIPRPFKDVILGTVNRLSNRNLTVAISNLGQVQFPGPVDSHVGAVFTHVSAARPQFCVISRGDRLTVSFTSPFIETAHQKSFVRALTAQGVAVTMAASRVTAGEMEAARR